MVESVYSRLSENAALAEKVAIFRNEPAIFYQSIPDDTDVGWGEIRYPRIVFTLEMQGDPERHTSGRLLVDTITIKNAIEPEEIDQIVKDLLGGVFLTDTDKTAYAITWDRSDLFSEYDPGKGTTAKGILGITSTFDVVEFPVQLTTDPDPVQAMHLWSEENLNDIFVVGYDCLPAVWKPLGGKAAVYWRVSSIGPASMHDSFTVSWHSVQLVGHILAESHALMQSIAKIIIDTVQQAGEVIMADTSPMFVSRVTYNAGADPVKQGQIVLTASYGVLRKPMYANPVNHIYANESR